MLVSVSTKTTKTTVLARMNIANNHKIIMVAFVSSMFFTILPEVKNMLSSDTHVSVSAPANTQTNEGGKKNANVWQTYQRLLEGVEAVANSDTWKDFLGFLTKFSLRKYSFRNILLIYSQMPTASLVGGFRTWQKHGRFVKRGERGIAIFAPVIIRVPKAEYRVGRNSEASEQDADALPEPEKEETLVGYRIVHVFDISQTEGKPLAVPEIDMHVPENQNASVLLQKLLPVIPCPVRFETLSSGVQGMYRVAKNEIAISQALNDTEKFTTLLHEYTHYLLYQHQDALQRTYNDNEVIAESVAYIVATTFGVELRNASFNYVVLYHGNPKKLLEMGELIQEYAVQILETLGVTMTSLDDVVPNKGST
jgi:hypothetical protein